MKEIPIILKDEYTCQNCGLDFRSSPQEIEVGFSPVCSQKCTFQKVFSIIKNMEIDKEMLEFYYGWLELGSKNIEMNRKNIDFQLSKYFLKLKDKGKFIILGSNRIEPAQVPEPTLAQEVGSFIPLGGYEPMSQAEPKPILGSSLSQGLSQYFSIGNQGVKKRNKNGLHKV
jgi:hypothetical protein